MLYDGELGGIAMSVAELLGDKKLKVTFVTESEKHPWVLPLYFVTRKLGIFDTYWGLLLPHVAVHICFFSWIMKGFCR